MVYPQPASPGAAGVNGLYENVKFQPPSMPVASSTGAEIPEFEPVRPAHYSFRIDVPGDADEVEHRGRPDLVTAIARGRDAQDLVPGFGAAVNIGEIKPRKRRGWLSE